MRTKFFSACLLLLATQCLAQLRSYTYTRRLNDVTKEGYYAIPLQPEIMGHSVRGGNDMRLYDLSTKDTAEVPYLMEFMGDVTKETPVPVELINDVSNLKCCSYITLKMYHRQVINHISLDVAEKNFDKRFSLEGSNDNREWFRIRDHLRITGFEANDKFRSTTFYFPDVEYDYFRLAFDDDSSDPITVTNAVTSEVTVRKGQYDRIAVKARTESEDKTAHTSQLLIELPDRYSLSNMILKGKAGNDFYRNIDIYAEDMNLHPDKDGGRWLQLGSDVFASDRENNFELFFIQTKKLKLVIHNYNDAPVAIGDIQLFSQRTVLLAKLPAGHALVLAYGSEGAQAPEYDMSHFQDKLPDVKTLPEISYGKEEDQREHATAAATSPLLSDKKWLWIVMVVVIGIIGYFAFTMLRKEM